MGAGNPTWRPPIEGKSVADSGPKRCPQWCPGCPIWCRPICTPGGGICPNLHSWGTKKADASEMDVGRKALPRRGLELLILVQQGLTSPSVTIPLSTPNRTRTCNLRFRRPMLYPIELWAHKPNGWNRPFAFQYVTRIPRKERLTSPIAARTTPGQNRRTNGPARISNHAPDRSTPYRPRNIRFDSGGDATSVVTLD